MSSSPWVHTTYLCQKSSRSLWPSYTSFQYCIPRHRRFAVSFQPPHPGSLATQQRLNISSYPIVSQNYPLSSPYLTGWRGLGAWMNTSQSALPSCCRHRHPKKEALVGLLRGLYSSPVLVARSGRISWPAVSLSNLPPHLCPGSAGVFCYPSLLFATFRDVHVLIFL